MVAGYRLDFYLDAGRKGEIFRASRTDCGQPCRIRILATDAQHAQRFLGDAKLAAALFHPNVADVYEVGSLDSGECFVVEEDTGCETLSDFLKTSGVPQLLTSIQIVRQAAEALHAIHLKGLRHLAIRPENIILTTDHESRRLVKIQNIDFGGVGQSIVSNKFLIDSALDSLKYFAPEQFDGEAASERTDVYSLGIVFYEMLAGAPPFDAPSAAGLIEKHKSQPPPDIKIDNFNLRMLVTHALTEALQKRPESRQSSANAFARQLRHIEQLANHVSTPPPAGIVPPAPSRSVPRVSVALAASATIRPAVVMETLTTIYKDIQPATAFKTESDPVPFIDLESSADLPEIPALITAEIPIEKAAPVIENFDEAETIAPVVRRRSRLKLHRKRPTWKPVLPAIGIIEKTYLTAVEPIQVMPVQLQAVTQEISAYQPEPEAIVAIPEPMKPTRIEWNQPEDDIPSVEDVMEVLAKEQVTEISVVQSDPEQIAAAGLQNSPIQVNQPEDDIPPKERITEIPVVLPAPEKIAVAHARSKPEIPAVPVEPEEITLVRSPGRRIKIEWGQPTAAQKFSRHTPEELSFSPTILGNRKRKIPDLDPGESFLSAYYGPSRTSVPYRFLMIGGGFMALLALFLFGSDSVWTYVKAWKSGDSMAEKTTSVNGTLPPAAPIKAVSPSRKKTRKYLDNTSGAERSTPPAEARSPLSDTISPTSAVKTHDRNRPSKPAAGSQNVGKLPQNGKTKPGFEPAKKSTDKKLLQISSKVSGVTRPRIVKDRKH